MGSSVPALALEAGGTWSYSAAPSPTCTGTQCGTPDVTLHSVSCPSAGNCSAVGHYWESFESNDNFDGLLLNDVSGTWQDSVAALPGGPGPYPDVLSVSCSSAGNCSAVGSYTACSNVSFTCSDQGLLLDEVSGTWQTGIEALLPAAAATIPAVSLTTVSCASAGNCSAVGVARHEHGTTLS